MTLYKWFLVFCAIALVALFAAPRIAAHAAENTPRFPEAQPASYEQMIYQYASAYGVDGKLALSIARCESQLNPHAKNTGSTATGIFQFLHSSWEGYSLLHWGYIPDVEDGARNIELGVWVLARDGTTPWVTSRPCWGPSL